MDAIPDALLIADDERRYVEANPAACELLRATREEILGRRVEDLTRGSAGADVHGQWRDFIQQGHQRGRDGRGAQWPWRSRRANSS